MLLKIENLTAGYEKDKPVLNNFSLEIGNNESIGVVGQNGCGKSTLAKAIMGITPYNNGGVLWEGKEIIKTVTEEKNKIGIGFFVQGGKVFENLSVEENLKFAYLNQPKSKFEIEVAKWKDMNIPMLTNKNRYHLKASFLSGGEKHILALIMTIIANPNMKLLIADEPSAGVAAGVQEKIIEIINLVKQEKEISLLLIEHNQNFLNQLTNKLIKI